MKQNSTVRVSDFQFEDLTSPKQRAAINELLCGRFGAPPGTEIECKALRVERRGGLYWADLRAAWEGARLDFSVKFMNDSGEVNFSEGWRLKRNEPLEMHLYRGA